MSGSILQATTIDAAPESQPASAQARPPSVTPDAPAEAGYEQTVQIGTITAGGGVTPLSVVFLGTPPDGTVTINAQDQVLYTAPANVTAGQVDSFTYEVENADGGFSAPIANAITLDPGPTATDPNFVIGHAGTLDLTTLLGNLATPGLQGDTLTLTGASAANGEIVQNAAGDFIYDPIAPETQIGFLTGALTGSTAQPAPVSNDTITYTVTDQLGDSVTGTASVTVDPGPTATDPTLKVGLGQSLDLSSIVGELAVPGLSGDTLTLIAASASSGTILQTKAGDLVYQAASSGGGPTTVGYDLSSNTTGSSGAGAGNTTSGASTAAGDATSGGSTITYTVTDQLGDTVTGTAVVALDPGPTATDPTLKVSQGQPLDLSAIVGELATPGLSGDTLTLSAASAANGTIVQASSGDWIYEPAANSGTAASTSGPAATPATPAGGDSITYTVTDQLGDSVTGTASVEVDPGPVATDPALEVGHGQFLDLSAIVGELATPGLSGDTLTLTAASAANGSIFQTKGGDLVYSGITAGSAPVTSDTITYTVADQLGDSVTGTASLTVDPGPTAIDPTLVVGQGGTIDLSAIARQLATPGLSGDTLTVTAASAANGTIVQNMAGDFVYELLAGDSAGSPTTVGYDLASGNGSGSGTGKGSTSGGATPGSDTITYTVTDQLGDNVTGTASVLVDPGPTATDPTLTVGHAGTLDLSQIVGQLATPGLSGDTLTVIAASAQSGTVIQDKAGNFYYEPIATTTSRGPAGATGQSQAALQDDVVTYTVQDQAGDSITGTADIMVDPGPTVVAGQTVVRPDQTVNLAGYLQSLVVPGFKADSETIVSASALTGQVTVGNAANGAVTVDYTAVAGGSDTLTFTVEDQYGDMATGTVAITADAGPVLAPGSYTIGHGQSANLQSYVQSLITPGAPGVGDTITSVQAEYGQAELAGASGGIGAASETPAIDYTAPASGNDVLTYTVEDQNGLTATGNVAITVDPGPIVSAGSLVVGQDQTVNLTSYLQSLIAPGLPGDTDTIRSVSTDIGAVQLESATTTGDGGIAFTAPASGSGTLAYTVTDQYGDTATGTVAITVDPGPTVTPATTTVGHGQSVNLTAFLQGLVQPGEPGDTETITSVEAQAGTVQHSTFVDSKGGPQQVSVGYTAPAQGNDTLTYTVADQFGDTATGKVAVIVDPGPVAGNVASTVQVGQSVDLTQQILGADQPGLAGDTLTLVADGTQGTLGNVSLANGDLVYTASNAAFAALAGGASASDSFTYTVSDQFGDQATGTVTLDVTNPVTTVSGNPNGDAVIQGPGGNAVINAYGWNNTIDANGGNDTINAGQGNATVNAGSGNVTVNLNGYNNVVTGGDGSDSVSGSLGNTSVTLGNGNDTVNLGGYGNAVTVGNGNDTIVAGAGSATVVGGSGTDVVTLQGYQDSVSFTGGNDTIAGGAGDDTFDLTGGSASLALNGDGNMVFLHSTNATIVDAGQATSITIAGGGTDVIQGAGSDPSLVVDLTGGLGGYTSAASALASLTSDGNGGAMLSFGASHGSLDFVGVAPSVLHASNFQVG